jgi:hypothetical protein
MIEILPAFLVSCAAAGSEWMKAGRTKTLLTPQTVFLRLSGLISFCSAALKGRERQNKTKTDSGGCPEHHPENLLTNRPYL